MNVEMLKFQIDQEQISAANQRDSRNAVRRAQAKAERERQALAAMEREVRLILGTHKDRSRCFAIDDGGGASFYTPSAD